MNSSGRHVIDGDESPGDMPIAGKFPDMNGEKLWSVEPVRAPDAVADHNAPPSTGMTMPWENVEASSQASPGVAMMEMLIHATERAFSSLDA